ncbi:MAG: hypothetical protein WA814_10260 [Candidatus Baltobacteraceae bacterium]
MIVRDDEYLDFSKVPTSQGVPVGIYRVVIVGIVIIFAIGGAVVMTAGYGHHWPAATTMRASLNP